MPLRKVWNSLRSHSKQAESTQSVSDSVEHEVVKLQAAAPGASESKRRIRRNKSKPSSELSNLLCQLQPQTILEIGVGDGSRAVEFLTVMKTTGHPVRYFAIDQFELAGGQLSLIGFHQMLRSAGIRPHLFPEPIVQGLTSFLHTIGSADVILITDASSEATDIQVQQLLGRISHHGTKKIQLSDGVISTSSVSNHSNLRDVA